MEGEMTNIDNHNKPVEGLTVTPICTITQEDGNTTCCPFGLLQDNTLPDSAFSASSGNLIISLKRSRAGSRRGVY